MKQRIFFASTLFLWLSSNDETSHFLLSLGPHGYLTLAARVSSMCRGYYYLFKSYRLSCYVGMV